MAETYKDHLKTLHHDIERLQDEVDGKNRELQLIEMDMIEVLRPSMLGSKITNTVCEMIMELVVFEKSKGVSPKTIASKKRLMGLLEDTEQLNILSKSINSLKLIGKQLYSDYQLLRVQNMKLKEQIQRAEDAVNF